MQRNKKKPSAEVLYISTISLRNVRCFKELDIEFDELAESILLLGENGFGKSTVLRAIAMGLCDQSSASALFRELPGEYVRRWPERDIDSRADHQGHILIGLKNSSGDEYQIKTEINGWFDNFERVDQTVYERRRGRMVKMKTSEDFPWGKIFISAYGAGLRVKGTENFQDYLAVDAVYSLFRYDAHLQNAELFARRFQDEIQGSLSGLGRKFRQGSNRPRELLRIEKAEQMREDFMALLGDVIGLAENEAFELHDRGIVLVRDQELFDLAELGDGYRATVTWVADFIAWWFLFCRIEDVSQSLDVCGIVIVDEIEQHLHPLWQARILSSLRKNFMHVQFITSTHSPLVASSSKDVSVRFLRPGSPTTEIESPYGWRAEEVYMLMGLSNSRIKDFSEKILDRFQSLDLKRIQSGLSGKEKRELSSLRNEITKTLPESDPAGVVMELDNISKLLE